MHNRGNRGNTGPTLTPQEHFAAHAVRAWEQWISQRTFAVQWESSRAQWLVKKESGPNTRSALYLRNLVGCEGL